MGEIVIFTLPWPDRALHSNSRAHYMVKASAVKSARHMAKVMAGQAGVGEWPNATILIEYYPPTRRGDVHNVPSSLKAYIDGIADAMQCDDRGFEVPYPHVFSGTRKPGEVVFRIMPSPSETPHNEGNK